MTERLVFLRRARDDQEDILDGLLAVGGQAVASKFQDRFETLFSRLLQFPESGAPRPELGRDVRIGVVWPYVVVYRYDLAEDTVLVQRIVHGRRDIPGTLR